MYTECPNCHTFFRIGPEQLKAAGGKVRCGQCDHIFNALDTLTETLPEHLQAPAAEDPPHETPAEETTTAAPQDDAPPSPDDRDGTEIGAETTTESEAELIQSTLDDSPTGLEEIFAEDEAEIAKEFGLEEIEEEVEKGVGEAGNDGAPDSSEGKADKPINETRPTHREDRGDDDEFEDWGDLDEPLSTLARTTTVDDEPASGLVAEKDDTELAEGKESRLEEDSLLNDLDDEEDRPDKRRSTALWGGVIGLLGLVLLGQLAYLKRNELSQIPSLRPVVAQLCALTGCQLPPLRDLSAIHIESRDVRSHPDRPGALLVNATFANTAEFVQPYPVMRLRFTDIQGRVVAERQFQPAEYLGPGIDVERGMPPGVPIHIKLEIADPGEEAVNFEFDFT